MNRKALVTGASRGIGAATAVKLAEAGYDVALNFRQKGSRAERISEQIGALGQTAILVQADITDCVQLTGMMATVAREFGQLDLLVLNASGGLESGKAEDYAMKLNLTAQIQVARAAAEIMKPGSRIVFVTSHWAHFYGTKPILPAYEEVAKSKRAGEDALRTYSLELVKSGISLLVVSGDAIQGTITLRLLERIDRGKEAGYATNPRVLPTVDEFAGAIVKTALDERLPNGHTVFVGSTEW